MKSAFDSRVMLTWCKMAAVGESQMSTDEVVRQLDECIGAICTRGKKCMDDGAIVALSVLLGRIAAEVNGQRDAIRELRRELKELKREAAWSGRGSCGKQG